jgi:AraC-like DNA-binding protein
VSASVDDVPLRGLRPAFAALQTLGVDARAWLAELAVSPAAMLEPTATISRAVWIASWRRAEELARDPAFGVRVADLIPMQLFAEVGYETEYTVVQAAATAPTVDDALHVFARYLPLVGTSLAIEDTRDTRIVRIADRDVVRALADMMLALIVKLVNALAIEPALPAEVRLARPEPADTVSFRRVFGRVRFAAGEHAIEFSRASLALAMRSAQPQLHARITAHVASRLGAPCPRRFADEVAAAVETRLHARREASAAALARELGVSVRTLARRLGAEQTTHRAVLDHVRARLSERYLKTGELAVKEIADRLGFADASAFHRAYRRWFGHPPAPRPDKPRH